MSTASPRPFRPSPWLANGHLQTLLGNTVRRTSAPPTIERQRIELDDGDFVDLDIMATRSNSAASPWVLLLHGLEGSSRSVTVRSMATTLADAGFEACMMNYRGCSGEPNRLPRAYHGGATDDVLTVMKRLAAQRPHRRFAAVGFSIGANLLMNLWRGDDCEVPDELVATVAVSPPFDLERCARFLDQPFRLRSLYRRRMVHSLRHKALAKLAQFPGCIAASRAVLRSARTFTRFDEIYTAPIHGFDDAKAYWHAASGGRFLSRIDRPMLILTAADDPFFPADYVPREAIAANPRLELMLTGCGGHCGFVTGPIWSPTGWAEQKAVAFLAGHVAATHGADRTSTHAAAR